MQRLLDSIPEECLNRSWYETFDADSFAVVWNTLPRNIQKELDAGLDGVRLAVTGAHGDFRDRHVFIDADRATSSSIGSTTTRRGAWSRTSSGSTAYGPEPRIR
jgi:hypothetical protein